MLPEPWGHPRTLNHQGEGCSEPPTAPFSPSQQKQATAATSIHPAGGGISSRATQKNDPKITDFSTDLNQGRFALQRLPTHVLPLLPEVGSSLEVARGSSGQAESGRWFAFRGPSERWKRRCQERCHRQLWGIERRFPSYGRAQTLPEIY